MNTDWIAYLITAIAVVLLLVMLVRKKHHGNCCNNDCPASGKVEKKDDTRS